MIAAGRRGWTSLCPTQGRGLDGPGEIVLAWLLGMEVAGLRLGKLVSLGCIAPDIVTAIAEGRQPVSLTAKTLSTTDLPPTWSEQRKMLGFARLRASSLRLNELPSGVAFVCRPETGAKRRRKDMRKGDRTDFRSVRKPT